MVDASVGGKNGIAIGVYKNMVGTIKQPLFLLYDFSLLNTLPHKEWISGFAEIIKHACIQDATMFNFISEKNLPYFKENRQELTKLIIKNVSIKNKIVQKDEFEKGDRKLLNFGHTIGHAIENTYQLSHGNAVSIGMVLASKISEKELFFKDQKLVESVLKKYGLKTRLKFDVDKTMEILKNDKKMKSGNIQFILLKSIGKSVIKTLDINNLQNTLKHLL